MNTIKTTSILGVAISAITYTDALNQVGRWIKDKKRSYVCVAAAHLLMECQRDEKLKRGVNKAGLVTPDGMPLVWLSWLYGHTRVERVYGPTLMRIMCERAELKAWRVFLLGGSSGQSKLLVTSLKSQFPDLVICGAIETPGREIFPDVNTNLCTAINRSRAKIVFVGMGCPYQERWMIDNRSRLSAPVLIGVGAAFDFISGTQKQAPGWIQNVGLEWMYRLFHEPNRLWYRYTADNAAFLLLVVKQILRDFLLH